jgi:hypothetical protein
MDGERDMHACSSLLIPANPWLCDSGECKSALAIGLCEVCGRPLQNCLPFSLSNSDYSWGYFGYDKFEALEYIEGNRNREPCA